MTYREMIEKVSSSIGLPKDVVEKTYKAYWLFIRESIQKLPLKDNITEGEFQKLRTNFNIPSLGKLTCTYEKYLRVRERFYNIIKLRNKDAEHKESETYVQ